MKLLHDICPKDWFKQDALVIAKELLGKRLEYNGTSGIIIETECYKRDEASHAHVITPRSEIMLKTYGTFYIYFIYGMYFCLNITTNEHDAGAVLIRALEPISGIPLMEKRRKTQEKGNLINGPSKICSAMNITKELNGTEVNDKIFVYHNRTYKDSEILATPRIGIKKALDLNWRFLVKTN